MLQALRDKAGRGAVARVIGLPFPWRGLNLRDRMEEGSVEYATIMDNIIAENGEGIVRNGSSSHMTGFTADEDVESLMVYSSGTEDKLFAACDGAIYDATTAGAVGSAVVSSLSGNRWIDTMFATTSGNYMVIANGADSVRNFDGSSWTTPSITGVTSADLDYVTSHKGRLFFIEKNTLSLWYLATNAIAGAATEFPVGALCQRGGRLVAVSSWSVDAGDGQDDLLVMITSNGEVLVYSGTDPGNNYALVGIFRTDRPLGNRCMVKYGGDLIILTRSGPVSCSELMNAPDVTENRFSELVRPAFIENGISYGSNFGWQSLHYTSRGWLVFNIPSASVNSANIQYVFNDGAWFRFTGMDAACWAEMGGNLYFGTTAAVHRADNSSASGDNSTAVLSTVQWAWSRFKTAQVKRFTMARPHIIAGVTPSPYIEMKTDYDTSGLTNQPTVTAAEGATWDVSAWDETAWSGSEFTFAQWIGLANIGTVGALRVAFSNTAPVEIRLQSCEIVFETGGIL